MSTAERKRAQQRERSRRYRVRQARGSAMLPVEMKSLDKFLLVALEIGALTDKESRNRKKVASFLADVGENWANEWLKNRNA